MIWKKTQTKPSQHCRIERPKMEAACLDGGAGTRRAGTACAALGARICGCRLGDRPLRRPPGWLWGCLSGAGCCPVPAITCPAATVFVDIPPPALHWLRCPARHPGRGGESRLAAAGCVRCLLGAVVRLPRPGPQPPGALAPALSLSDRGGGCRGEVVPQARPLGRVWCLALWREGDVLGLPGEGAGLLGVGLLLGNKLDEQPGVPCS